jgi:predicted aspartyl protease
MPHTYDASFTLSFPVLPVVIHQVEGGLTTSPLSALVDTGADTTLVPIEFLKTVKADEIYTSRMRTHWGEWHPVAVYLVDLEVAAHRLPTVEVVADDYDDRVILGRNVLNKLILLLDGPSSQTDILIRRPVRL